MCDIHIIHKYYVYMMQFVLFLCDEILVMIWWRMLKNAFTCLYTELHLYHNDNIYIYIYIYYYYYYIVYGMLIIVQNFQKRQAQLWQWTFWSFNVVNKLLKNLVSRIFAFGGNKMVSLISPCIGLRERLHLSLYQSFFSTFERIVQE